MAAIRVRFPQGMFAALRERLLNDPSREAFALLFGQSHALGDHTLIKVVATHVPRPEDYVSQGLAHLRLRREYIYDRLVEMQRRGDVDTLIDVHTHPFCTKGAAFSGHDDRDERDFHAWLTHTLDGIQYASIVLSQSDYAARLWQRQVGRSHAYPVQIRTQTVGENWPRAEDPLPEESPLAVADSESGFLARSALALGLDTLRRIVHDQCIAIIGVGGLGSVIAENLIHTGFHHLHLIDPDRLEITNLNRIVGAHLQDAKARRFKVEVVRDHLLGINPQARVEAHAQAIEEEGLWPAWAEADWILLATDNHASRFHAQALALRLAIPLISAGVNISVMEGRLTDMSGEVILARTGDTLCLNCLGRISPTQVAADTVAGLGAELARRGYVSGQDVKEPAVKTLNAMVGALAVEVLVNQYTERQPPVPVWVYENTTAPCFYPDAESVAQRVKGCFHCA